MSNDDRYDIDSLADDLSFATPLRRVSFQAGMLLGVDATQAEQDYHRRRLVRHHYWFHGYGTLLGMAVTTASSDPAESGFDSSLTLNVSPGIGIDGLGREVMIHEAYCINLSDWLASQSAERLVAGVDRDQDGDLTLLISVRYQDCASGLQPTLATRLNDSTDPVAASRIADSLLLELIPVRANPDYAPWPAHPFDLSANQDSKFSSAEQARIAALSGNAQLLATQQARLLYALTPTGDAAAPPTLQAEGLAEELARIPLAEVRIASVSDLNAMIGDNLQSFPLNATTVTVDNLIRPFVQSHSQLAAAL